MRKLNKLWKLRKESDKYRLMQYLCDAIGFGGIVIAFFAKKLSEASLDPWIQMILYLIIGALAIALCRIGSKHYSYMEREAIKEQREESRRVMKSAS